VFVLTASRSKATSSSIYTPIVAQSGLMELAWTRLDAARDWMLVLRPQNRTRKKSQTFIELFVRRYSTDTAGRMTPLPLPMTRRPRSRITSG